MPGQDAPRQLFVLKAEDGRTLMISEVLPSGSLVVDDVSSQRRLGELQGDLTPFVIETESGPQIVFAGDVGGGDRAQFVFLDLPHNQQVCRVVREPMRHQGFWMSFPEPFEPGMTITAIWQDEQSRELWRAESPPLTSNRLDPIHGPGWTSYAPL